MRGRGGGHEKGLEGQGEVIDVRPVPLSFLDASPEMLQSGFWGHFKQAHGWTPFAFEVRAQREGVPAFPLLVLTRRLARFSFLAYVPFGPVEDPRARRGEFLSRLAAALRRSLPRRTLFLRFDLPWLRAGDSPAARGRPAVVKAANDMQPASTVVVDLSPELDRVIASMKSKTRYNIRLAEKKGVTVDGGSVEDLEPWYELYQETSSRDRIAIHSRAYYRGLFDAATSYPGARPTVHLLIARHGGDMLAGNIVAFWKDRAAYLYGASSGVKRNLMPTYALQWEAIRQARAAGCRSYDLYGVPALPDSGHPMFGLYQFKTGFSETVVERWGTWDAPFRPVLYSLFRSAEALRMLWYRRLRKLLRGRPRGSDS